MFDKIFVINLAERKDRWDDCIKQFKKYNITNYERFNAIKPKLEDIDKEQYKDIWVEYKDNEKYICGAMGCKFSHLQVIKICKERKYKQVLILEDDFLLCNNFNNEITNLFKNLDLKWSMFYLGCSWYRKSLEVKNHTNIRKAIGVLAAHAYILKDIVFDRFITEIENSTIELDNVYKNLQKRNKIYMCNPSLITQKNGFSNIVYKNVMRDKDIYFKK